MNRNILESLEKIFTKQQSLVYLYLLKNPGRTVYQISKDLELSRSTIYPVVESMYNKGYISVLSSESNTYYPENPESLINTLRMSYNNTFDILNKELKNYHNQFDNDYFVNISSYESNISKAKELLRNTEKEVYINTDIDIELFDEEFDLLEKKNVKIFLFCFRSQNCKHKNIEFYTYNDKCVLSPTRIMLVSDYKIVFTSGRGNKNDWIGTITNNGLMVDIISEHIHHDIYLYKIQRKIRDYYLKQGLESIDLFSSNNPDNILLNSEMENRSFIININDKKNKKGSN